MNSVITHVILPAIGSVCVECFSRGHIAGLSRSPAEVYSFGVTKTSGPAGLGRGHEECDDRRYGVGQVAAINPSDNDDS